MGGYHCALSQYCHQRKSLST
uniref:Uncharacterized protein n=1 Tax=Anguilla anguilla TaxID=7936 RepID=A0A0E9QPE5_ANGAN